MSEGGHAGQSQHYAGVAFDVGQKMSATERNRLRDVAQQAGVWNYIEPKALTPTWVHMDKRIGPSACSTGGYPIVKRGSKGVYVALLQDALNDLKYNFVNIDGVFGNNTKRAVMNFQRDNNLTADGVVGCSTWKKLASKF